ncbi:ABC transporter substrate-binding protein [Pigmentiphaga sp. NML080357]|uniref:Bug family tripartite tricarboxylate transporter substrate binding protein n=1 Tax=Pigmentiphaga sp. NML080357 TaxID=2008675 RepID=UPI000B41ED8F|nr:tripartite tricarboxylate transporter substrate-binding protein [Pigmentiphaga sp. NML080357]OVZ59422.1 ABC transporter substrate-binding protein [Pigmentiphaga sp. NML080357]
MKYIVVKVLAAAMLLAWGQSAVSAGYPEKPVNLVVPFAAGSPTDALVRIIAGHLGTRLGQPAVVVNKPGASGIIGTSEVAKAAPDGYTLLFSTNTTQAANAALFKKLPYDPVADFEAIAIVGGVPHVLVVNAALPVATTEELIKYAKSHPEKVAFAHANSTTRITGSTFRVMTGTAILDVPYKTYPQAVAELLGGQTNMMFIDFATGLQHIRSGRLRALALTPQRSEKLPGVRAVSETLPGFVVGNWAGLFAPAGTSQAIVERLNREVNQIIALPEVKAQVDNIGYELNKPMSAREFSRFVESEKAQYAELVKNAGIQPE